VNKIRAVFNKIAPHRVWATACLSLAIASSSGFAAASGCATTVWYHPPIDSPDLLDLFKRPEEWARSRSRIGIFKLGPPGLERKKGGVSYSDLSAAAVFKTLEQWGICIASEEGAVKEWDCSGTQASIITASHIENVGAAGGRLGIVAMDEPLASGTGPCKLSLEETASRTATYVKLVVEDNEVRHGGVVPAVGDIEPYPSFSVGALKQWTKELAKHGFKPAFFHLDINVHRVDVDPSIDLAGDLRALQAFYRTEGIPFGIIFWSGYDPLNSDRVYYDHVMDLVRRVKAAIGRPDQVIFQSWIKRSPTRCGTTDTACQLSPCTPDDPPYCGEKSIPLNVPENDPNAFTHTRLINDALDLLEQP
jgi:hypothetical protein